jgi:biopolymer transport protein ExbD
MFGTGGDHESKIKAEINVTPLVDVVLVLLIIFMVVTPLLTHGDVQLPIASSVDPTYEAPDAIVLTIARDGALWVDRQRVSQEHLARELKTRLGEHPEREVLIKADASVSVRDLRPVLHRLKSGGITQIAFGVLDQQAAKP